MLIDTHMLSSLKNTAMRDNNYQAKMKKAVAVKVVSGICKFNSSREWRQHHFSWYKGYLKQGRNPFGMFPSSMK